MAQHDYDLVNDQCGLWRQDLNGALAAIKSQNSHASTAPASAVAGMRWCKTVDATHQEVYEYDGSQWILLYVISPTTHRIVAADGQRRIYGGVAGGTANVLTITTSPAVTGYSDGMRFVLVVSATPNSGAATLNVDGQGAISIKIEGADPASGELAANAVIEVIYYSALFHVVGGASRKSTTAVAGMFMLADEATFLAGTSTTKVPTADVMRKHAHERLSADRTYYVRTDGNDSNTGLVDSAGGAFLTLQKAWNVASDLDVSGFVVTIQLGAGTYTAGIAATKRIIGAHGAESIVVNGNAVSPSSVIVHATGTAFAASQQAKLTIQNLKVECVTSGSAISADGEKTVVYFANVVFGSVPACHLIATGRAKIAATGVYSITAGADTHASASEFGTIDLRALGTVTLTGTVTIVTAFALATRRGCIQIAGTTYSGAASGAGKKYDVQMRAVVATAGVTLPGVNAGTTATGGQFT